MYEQPIPTIWILAQPAGASDSRCVANRRQKQREYTEPEKVLALSPLLRRKYGRRENEGDKGGQIKQSALPMSMTSF